MAAIARKRHFVFDVLHRRAEYVPRISTSSLRLQQFRFIKYHTNIVILKTAFNRKKLLMTRGIAPIARVKTFECGLRSSRGRGGQPPV